MSWNPKSRSADPIYMQDEDQDDISHKTKKDFHRDYISIRSKERLNKKNYQYSEDLLQYYTSQSYNRFVKQLAPPKDHFDQIAKQEISQLEEMVRLGHNVCVFGKGSKINLMKSLHTKILKNYFTFEINAFRASVTEKKIFTHFGGFLVDCDLIDQIEQISIKDLTVRFKQILLQHEKIRICVLLHSLDGPNIWTAQSQQKLADLFQIAQIQLVCSIDSMKICSQWSALTLQKYRFTFFNINTGSDWLEQLRYRPLKSQSSFSTQDSFLQIWQSVSTNQKKIIKFIAQRQLANLAFEQSQKQHYNLTQLLDKCIDEIVLSSDHQLRFNLLQLLDHKVVSEKLSTKSNRKVYRMMYQKPLLDKIMQLKID